MVMAMMIYDYDDEAGEYTCDRQPGGFWRRCGGGHERPPQQELLGVTVHMLLVVPSTKNIMVHNCYIVVQNGVTVLVIVVHIVHGGV